MVAVELHLPGLSGSREPRRGRPRLHSGKRKRGRQRPISSQRVRPRAPRAPRAPRTYGGWLRPRGRGLGKPRAGGRPVGAGELPVLLLVLPQRLHPRRRGRDGGQGARLANLPNPRGSAAAAFAAA
ncbi:hypothetical protein J1605_003117 [Eschrichtius robustus]|uniref:Uncharacterized protein n=1 Tax=Eschrichtius robustus TaxID=9764 RepID=A0AB34HUD6_ESCRO|nr:hypothetical protein J1605_003117 [Eschrichtius robustus]